ncbi:MAG TPA: potassium-transporting ATPase subunit C [Polyangiaceae bacterium]|nr:potassium-transporting ATPase subunit C [Polyangiaceae bacterium]
MIPPPRTWTRSTWATTTWHRPIGLKTGSPRTRSSPRTPRPRSGSGLDPEISIGNAMLQAPRVARARGWSPERVRQLLAQNQHGRLLGIFGEPRVNVLQLNLAMDAAK